MEDATRLRGILRAKRDGRTLDAESARWFLDGVARGEIGEPEQAALLSSIWFQGMTDAEVAAWTRAMVDSGASLDLSEFDGPKIDKHSTGGVGDKVSLVLAPALAELGCVVPMISGRGLGHTGGTLDKLEAIPGVRTDLDEPAIVRTLHAAGCAIVAQTESIAPADRRLYAMRDRVELVESIPLIASSIVSKKLAEDLDALVLDVKAGSASFLVDVERCRDLARAMVDLGRASGLPTVARITWMGRPLGRAVGHLLEVEETRSTLAGEGPPDLVEITCALGADLLVEVGIAEDEEAGRARVAAVLASGDGRERFERMLSAQGANGRTPAPAPDVVDLRAPWSGTLAFDDAREVGLAVRALGGGRSAPGDRVDHAVGLVWRCAAGDEVEAGDVLAEVHHREHRGLDEALARLQRSIRPATEAEPPLLLERIASGT
ncbi:MAG: thymidine phosphorylase [Planctomycetota bacterium]